MALTELRLTAGNPDPLATLIVERRHFQDISQYSCVEHLDAYVAV
jgi:hypothetical protein